MGIHLRELRVAHRIQSRTSRTRVAALVAACCALSATRASADDAEPVRLDYDAPDGCPRAADFLDLVARDGGRLVQVDDLEAARSLRVHVEGAGPYRGELTSRDSSGNETAREVEAPRCEDVVRSLAVLVALLAEPGTRSPPPVIAAQFPPAPTDPRSPQPAALAPTPWPEMLRSSDSDVIAPVALRSPRRWRLDVSGGFTVNTGAIPSLNPGLAAYVEVLDEAPSWLAPSIRVGAQVDENQGGSPFLTVRRMVGRLDACLFQAELSRPWSDDAFTLQPCGRVEVGRLDVELSDFRTDSHARRPWVAQAALLRLRWTSPRYFLELEGGASFPLVRERFSFGPGVYTPSLDFTVAPVAATTGLGFGIFLL